MTSPSRSPHADDDGVRIVRTAGARRLPWLVAAAVAVPIVVTIAAVVLIRASASAPGTPPAAPVADAVAGTAPPVAVAAAAPSAAVTPRAAPVAPRRVVAAPVEGRAPRDGASPAPETSPRELDAGDAIRALREEGIHTGIAAFGLPGTDPPKSGIVVPEDFPLPEGYVRHYQTTDDGEALPAILMFHPDYEFLDGRGRVVPVPADRVVRRGMAPPGLDPDRVLQVPERRVGEPVH